MMLTGTADFLEPIIASGLSQVNSVPSISANFGVIIYEIPHILLTLLRFSLQWIHDR
jgi:hypothetical protein